jgi:benzoyl-CoA-dihydrodiol lyase
VLPGTGGLTRVTDKRKVRRDRADVFCSVESEGVRGKRAVEWKLVDEVVPKLRLGRGGEAERSRVRRALVDREGGRGASQLTPLERTLRRRQHDLLARPGGFDRGKGRATITVLGPESGPPASHRCACTQGAASGRCAMARELDDADPAPAQQRAGARHLVIRTEGDAATGAGA